MTPYCCNGTVWEIRAANNIMAARPVTLPNRPPGAYNLGVFHGFLAVFVYTKVERKQTKGKALITLLLISSLLTDEERGFEDVNRDARFNSG